DADEIIRSVSKTGGLGLVSDDAIQWAQQLEDGDKASLYSIVRDESERNESEWRDEFIDRVRVKPESLPDPADESIDIREFLVWAASNDDRGEVLDCFEEIIERATDLIELRQQITESGQTDLLSMLDTSTSPDTGA
ncbi:MAG: hypothetical protein ACR2NK_10565, partial [Mariniblastus sp.]